MATGAASFFFAAALGSFAFEAVADASQCSDVLRDGTKATHLYSNNYAYRQIANLHFAQVGYEESKRDTSISGSIPIGKVVVGGEYNQSRYDLRREKILQTQAWDTQVTRNIDVLLSSGDEAILRAWTTCMIERKGGLSLRFINVRGRSAIAVIEWYGTAGVHEVRLQDFRPPDGVTVVSDGGCLVGVSNRLKTPIVSGTSGCHVQLSFDSARIPIHLTIHTDGQGSATAFLPPRTYIKETLRPFKFDRTSATPPCTGPDPIVVTALRHTGTSDTGTFCSDHTNGWVFDKESANHSTRVTRQFVPSLQLATVSFDWVGMTQALLRLGCSNSSKHDQQCISSPRIQEAKYELAELPD